MSPLDCSLCGAAADARDGYDNSMCVPCKDDLGHVGESGLRIIGRLQARIGDINLQVSHYKARYENACLGCDAMREEFQRANLQNAEMSELLRQADDLYTGYGLICGPIKGFPKYEGTVHQGEWIGKVRKITRAVEKRNPERSDKCIEDQHRGTECKCCHMIDHCCSHHCCCFYRCKCHHADYHHSESGKCDFPGCGCTMYEGRS